MGPVLSRLDDTFGSRGSHEGKATTLYDQTPITLEGFLSQSVGPNRETEVSVWK